VSIADTNQTAAVVSGFSPFEGNQQKYFPTNLTTLASKRNVWTHSSANAPILIFQFHNTQSLITEWLKEYKHSLTLEMPPGE